MANLSTPDNSQEILTKLTEILESLVDASASAKHFSNEVSSASQSASKMKRDAQDAMSALFSTTKKNVQASEELHEELENLSRDLPGIIKNTMSTIESGFAFTTGKMNMGYLVEKWTNPIFNEYKILQRKTLNEFDDQLEEIEKALRKAADEQTRNSLEVQKSMVQERRTSIANASENQLMARDNANFWKTELLKAGKKIIGDTFDFFRQKVTSAINNYSQTMQQTYTTIQSYNNYTEKQYDALFKRLKSSIDDLDLSNVININDLQATYTETIKAGLRGEIGETVAQYTEIAKQAGVTFDWQDSNFLQTVSRMDKAGNNMDEFFQELITTTENISEAAGHDFAFTNGQINTMVNNLNTLQQTLNLTDDAYIAAYKSFGTVGSMLVEQGIDATKIYSDITEVATKGITAGSTAQILNMGGLTQDRAKELISSGKTDEIALTYLKTLEKHYDGTTGEFTNKASQALGESLTPEEIEAYKNYIANLKEQGLTVEDEFARIYDYDRWAYDTMIESLENSETQTDQLQNTLDNWFAEWGKWANQNPILSFLAGTLLSTVTNIGVSYFSGGKSSVGGRTINNLLTKLFGKGSEAAANAATSTSTAASTATPTAGQITKTGNHFYQYSTGKNGNLIKNPISKAKLKDLGYTDDALNAIGNYGDDAAKLAANYGDDALKAASKGATGLTKLGKVGSFAGKAGKVLGKAAPWISAAFSIGSGINAVTKADDLGYEESGFRSFTRGMFTGKAEAAENGWDVAGGTLSGAATGAAIGSLFGPWGTAIGAAVGAIGGLVSGIVDLNDEEKKHQRELAKATKYYEDLNKKSAETAAALAKVEEESAKVADEKTLINALKEGEKPAQELLDAFPEYSMYLGENGVVTEKYIEKLNRAIHVKERLNAIEEAKLARESNDDLYGSHSNRNTLESETASKLKAWETADSVLGAASAFGSAVKAHVENDIVQLTDEEGNVSSIDKNNMIKLLNNAGITAYNGSELEDLDSMQLVSLLMSMYNGNFLNTSEITGTGKDANGNTVHKSIKLDPDGLNLGVDSKTGAINQGGDLMFTTTDESGNVLLESNAATHLSAAGGGSEFLGSNYTLPNLETYVDSLFADYSSAAAAEQNALESTYQTLLNGFAILGLDDSINSKEAFRSWETNNKNKFSNYASVSHNDKGSFPNVLYNYSSFLNDYLDYQTDVIKRPEEEVIEQLKKDFSGASPNNLKKYFKEIYPSSNIDEVPNWEYFSTGTVGDYSIPYDNYAALLHEGEQIRTKAEVTVERAERHIASSDAIGQLNSAVIRQTDTIINLLSQILNVTNVLASKSGLNTGNNTYDYAPIAL